MNTFICYCWHVEWLQTTTNWGYSACKDEYKTFIYKIDCRRLKLLNTVQHAPEEIDKLICIWTFPNWVRGQMLTVHGEQTFFFTTKLNCKLEFNAQLTEMGTVTGGDLSGIEENLGLCYCLKKMFYKICSAGFKYSGWNQI